MTIWILGVTICYKFSFLITETLVVEFRQYPHGASMRQAKLPRHNNGEQGGNQIGFYGGIRKLHSEEEIEKWKVLLPYDRRYM